MNESSLGDILYTGFQATRGLWSIGQIILVSTHQSYKPASYIIKAYIFLVNVTFNFAFDMHRSLDLLYVLFTVAHKNMVLGYQWASFYG